MPDISCALNGRLKNPKAVYITVRIARFVKK
jgi:hypothetical protein